MNNLTLDEYEKIYLTSSTITEETDIENYLLDLLPLSRKTALEAFDNFKAVLYIHFFTISTTLHSIFPCTPFPKYN